MCTAVSGSLMAIVEVIVPYCYIVCLVHAPHAVCCRGGHIEFDTMATTSLHHPFLLDYMCVYCQYHVFDSTDTMVIGSQLPYRDVSPCFNTVATT